MHIYYAIMAIFISIDKPYHELMNKEFGKNVKKYRKMRGLTQAQLSEMIDIEEMSLSRIECGSRFPRKENIDKLVQALDCSVSDLFNFEDEKSFTEAELRKEITKKLKHAKLNDLKYFNKIISAYWETKI